MTKDELIAKAEALGIDVDGRWSMKRIQEEIDALGVQQRADGSIITKPSVSEYNTGVYEPTDEAITLSSGTSERAALTIAVTVLRDVWDAEGERHRAGTVRHVSVEDAMDGIESGIYSRVKG